MFVGRSGELKELEDFVESASTKALLLYGKRRVGKTELLHHFFKTANKRKDSVIRFVYYECTRDTLENNISSFCDVLISCGVLKQKIGFSGFDELFYFISHTANNLCIIIDEYPYLCEFADNRTIDSQFQKVIDNNLGSNKLIITGSNIAVMRSMLNEKNALFARFDKVIELKELSYLDSSLFYKDLPVYDKIGFYSVFGGSPFINTFINPNISLKENIKNTFLNTTSAVFLYCQHILFSDFSASININGICKVLKNGKKSCAEIENLLSMQKNGLMNKKLETLVQMSLLSKNQPINKKGNNKQTKYEICDNAIRFFYTFVYENKSLLNTIGAEQFFNIYIKEKLNTFISYRFEEICRTYFSLLVKDGKLSNVADIGTYYYDDPKAKTNGEFDVALKLNEGSYTIAECKYYKQGNRLTLLQMKQEAAQVSSITKLNIDSICFISTSTPEPQTQFKVILAEELYDIQIARL